MRRVPNPYPARGVNRQQQFSMGSFWLSTPCSGWEPAVPVTGNSNVCGGWLPPLMVIVVATRGCVCKCGRMSSAIPPYVSSSDPRKTC